MDRPNSDAVMFPGTPRETFFSHTSLLAGKLLGDRGCALKHAGREADHSVRIEMAVRRARPGGEKGGCTHSEASAPLAVRADTHAQRQSITLVLISRCAGIFILVVKADSNSDTPLALGSFGSAWESVLTVTLRDEGRT
jgi:hypothetical protein